MPNSIKKGHNFERQVVKELSRRFKDDFARVPMSGAAATVRANELFPEAKQILAGDIITPPDFKFVVEAKARKEMNFWNFFSKNSEWQEWWQQALEEAKISGKRPLLIVKYNNKKILAGIEENLIKDKDIAYIKIKGGPAICLLSDLLSLNDNFFYVD